jgi:hypothetical protein
VAAHEQVEGERPGKDVIVMELRHGHDPLPPAGDPKRWQIQPTEEEQPGLRLPQPREQRGQRGLAAS